MKPIPIQIVAKPQVSFNYKPARLGICATVTKPNEFLPFLRQTAANDGPVLGGVA